MTLRDCFGQLLKIKNPSALPYKEFERYVIVKNAIAKIIDTVPDLRERAILTDRYINCKKISELEDIYYYSERHIKNIIKSGLIWLSLNYRGCLPWL